MAYPSKTRVVAAERLPAGHRPGMDVPGFVGPAYDQWPRGLLRREREAMGALRADSVARVTDSLRRLQRSDGSWGNAENLVKEDDPLIASAFAVRALAAGWGFGG